MMDNFEAELGRVYPRSNALYRALDQVGRGLILEFGVFEGKSLTMIADYLPDREVFGFDSFEGLPETWKTGTEEAGHFKCDPPKDLPGNANLVIGLFKDTLPSFLASKSERIAFIHMDCDLYSSTKCVLDEAAPWIAHGTIIAFDEILGYPGFESHEYLAFREFIARTGLKFECIGRRHDCSSIVRILK